VVNLLPAAFVGIHIPHHLRIIVLFFSSLIICGEAGRDSGIDTYFRLFLYHYSFPFISIKP